MARGSSLIKKRVYQLTGSGVIVSFGHFRSDTGEKVSGKLVTGQQEAGEH